MFIVYTDKFGQKLKEDGIYAGKTAYAVARYRHTVPARSEYTPQRITTPMTTISNNEVKLLSNKNDKSNSFIQPLPKYENKYLNQQIKKRKEMIYGTGTEMKNDPRQTYNYIVKKAKELNLPLELCLATAFKESSFKHYENDSNGNIMVNESAGDYGLMQININAHPQAFNNKEVYGDIINNWHDNVDYGLYYLKKCYEEAKSYGYTGNDLIKATYSNYNSGSCSAYKNSSHEAYENVSGFWTVYNNKTWQHVLN